MSPFNKHSLNKQNEATKWYIKSKAEISYIILDYSAKNVTLQDISCLWTTLPLHQLLWITALDAFLLLEISDKIIYHPPLTSTHSTCSAPFKSNCGHMNHFEFDDVETVYFNLFWLFIISLKLCWILLEPNDDSNSLIKSIHYKILQWTEAFTRISLVYIPISNYLPVVW